MSHHDYDTNNKSSESVQFNGTISDVFGHRFTITDAKGKKILADVGKHNQDRVTLEVGATVTASGRMKPSELKVESLTVNGKPVELMSKADHKEHGNDKREPGSPQDVAKVIQIAEDRGLTVIGQKVKPKHAEILGMSQENELTEMHIGFDGTVRATKPVAPDDQKWSKELAAA